MSKTILLVDDDKSLSRLYQELLPREGFAVICERDGEWGLNTFNQRPIDVVLLDVLVPVLNGFQVAERIRQTEKGKTVPIIFMSGVYKAQNHREAVRQKYGALEFLEKPFEASKLIALLKGALGAGYPKREERAAEEAQVEKKAATLADDITRAEVSEVERESTSNFKAGQSARGAFQTKPFAEIVAELYRWRSTGALLLRRDKVKKIVYFKEGHPIFIKSNLLSECLGKVMVRERMITEAECEASLKKMKDTGRQQGTLLIEMGCISPHNLKYALQLQLETKLFDVFGWQDGDWQFNPKADVPSPLTTLEMSPASMIYEGLRRAYDGKRIRESLGPVEAFKAAPSEDPLLRFQDIGMDPEETRLWELIDGQRTVRELAASGILAADDAYRFLYAMKCAQMIDLMPPPAAPAADDLDEFEAPTKKGPAPLQRKRPALDEEDFDKTPIEAHPPVPDAEPEPAPEPERPLGTPLAALMEMPASAPAPLASLLAEPAEPAPIPLTRESAPLSALLRAPVPVPAPESGGLFASLLGNPPPAAPLASLLGVPVTAASSASGDSSAREKLTAKIQELKTQNHYQSLGVEVDATREQIKRAYFSLSREFHPDKHFSAAGADVRALANELFDLITHGYEVLADPDSREHYRMTLPEEQREKQSVDPMSFILAAEGKFQKGTQLMQEKSYKQALELFKEAARLYPEEGEFHAFLGWSLYQTDPENTFVVQQSMDSLERAIALNPKSDKAYLFLGHIYRAAGKKDKAEKQYEKAIRVNPDCKEALAELKALAR